MTVLNANGVIQFAVYADIPRRHRDKSHSDEEQTITLYRAVAPLAFKKTLETRVDLPPELKNIIFEQSGFFHPSKKKAEEEAKKKQLDEKKDSANNATDSGMITQESAQSTQSMTL